MQTTTTPPKNKRLMLAIVMAGGVLLMLLAVFIILMGVQSGGTPKLVVQPSEINFGDVSYMNDQIISFTVTNTGDGDLRFNPAPNIEVLEGC